jgi:hypothetical protein
MNTGIALINICSCTVQIEAHKWEHALELPDQNDAWSHRNLWPLMLSVWASTYSFVRTGALYKFFFVCVFDHFSQSFLQIGTMAVKPIGFCYGNYLYKILNVPYRLICSGHSHPSAPMDGAGPNVLI